jgi:P22_AR N-terminal domain/ORF6C domain
VVWFGSYVPRYGEPNVEPASASTAQIPAEQVIITLFDAPCLAVRDSGGTIYVAVSDICAAVGIQTDAQLRRIRQHEQLQRGLTTFRVRQGNRMETSSFLHLQMTAGWLLQIATGRVRAEVRDRLRYLQIHLLDAVWQAFAKLSGLPANEEQIEDLQDLDQIDGALRHLAELATRQARLEESQDRARDAYRQVSERIRDLASRVAAIEQRVEAKISPTQRGHLYHLVQAWGTARAERTTQLTRAAVYSACWAEIKVRFSVARYEDLTPAQYLEAVTYVQQHYLALTGTPLVLLAQDELPL